MEGNEIWWRNASSRRAEWSAGAALSVEESEAVVVFYCKELLAVKTGSWMDDAKAGASLQTNYTDRFTRMQTSSEWLFLRCSAFDLHEAVTVKRFWRRLENKCNPVRAVRDNHSTSLVGQKQWNILLLNCSWQGGSLILHIPVFTKALFV